MKFLLSRDKVGGGRLLASDVPNRRLITTDYLLSTVIDLTDCPMINYTDGDLYMIPMARSHPSPQRADPVFQFASAADSLGSSTFVGVAVPRSFPEGFQVKVGGWATVDFDLRMWTPGNTTGTIPDHQICLCTQELLDGTGLAVPVITDRKDVRSFGAGGAHRLYNYLEVRRLDPGFIYFFGLLIPTSNTVNETNIRFGAVRRYVEFRPTIIREDDGS